MIIRPQLIDKSGSTSSLGFIESYDPLWGRNFSKKRIACNKAGDIRVEDITIYPDDKYLVKNCAFGKRISSYIDSDTKSLVERVSMKNHMSTTIDLKTGECIQWGSDSRSPLYKTTGYWLTAGETELEVAENGPSDMMSLNPNDTIYSTTKLRHCFTGFDLEAIRSSIYATENILQIGFSKCVGLLNAFFTQWSYAFPFDSFVILDTKHGFNVPGFKYFSIFNKDIGKKMYAKYVKSISAMFELLKRNCEYEKRDLRIYVFTSAYTTVIKIHDKDGRGFVLDELNLNASDHFNSVIQNMESDGPNWLISEECAAMMHTNNYDVTDTMANTYVGDIETIC